MVNDDSIPLKIQYFLLDDYMITIAIVGPKQCGSTMLFNMVQYILDEHKCAYDLHGPGNNKYSIVKVHEYDAALKATYVLLPYRDVRDSCVSSQKRFPDMYLTDEDYLRNMRENIREYNAWLKHANMCMKYEAYKQSPLECISHVARTIGFPVVNAGVINDKLNKLFTLNLPVIDDPNDAVYAKTLLTKSHNTSGGKINKQNELPVGVRSLLLKDAVIMGYLVEHGY